MQIPELGPLVRDPELGWFVSEPKPLPVLRGQECRIVLDYDEDENEEDFLVAARNFLSAPWQVLQASEPHIFRYYQDCNSVWRPDDEEYLAIAHPAGVWAHIQFGPEAIVTRRAHGDRGIYVDLSCECDWEPEHGLQIIFRDGLRVNKVGPYNGALTNSDAYGDPRLEHTVYKSWRS